MKNKTELTAPIIIPAALKVDHIATYLVTFAAWQRDNSKNLHDLYALFCSDMRHKPSTPSLLCFCSDMFLQCEAGHNLGRLLEIAKDRVPAPRNPLNPPAPGFIRDNN
jgi:hypothetical protein